METELQLIEAIRSGDATARRRLYEGYVGYATAVGRRYVPQEADLHDVLQDSFIKVFTGIGSFSHRGEGSLKQWIGRIVANQAIDHLRRQARFTLLDELPDTQADTDDEPDVGHIPPDVLTTLIGRLPTGYRTVLNLYVFEQLSHREIARRLGIKEGTSASQFLRAKQQLASMIKAYLNTQKA